MSYGLAQGKGQYLEPGDHPERAQHTQQPQSSQNGDMVGGASHGHNGCDDHNKVELIPGTT